MGTDIHAAFQAKIDGIWTEIDVSYWDRDRDYILFEWLGDPRQTAKEGVGFDVEDLAAWDEIEGFEFNNAETRNATHSYGMITPEIVKKKKDFMPQSLNWFCFMMSLLKRQHGEVRMFYGYDN